MKLHCLHSLETVSPSEWNPLVGGFPFLRHEFLRALERHGCLGRAHGWLPWYFLLRDPDERLVAALPAFAKLNSWGEFVFDFAWADAYHRNGLQYYPKLVAAAPFTPATGPRVLVAPGPRQGERAATLLQAVRGYVERQGWSGAHCLFPPAAELPWLQDDGWLLREDIQYHWHNHGYRDFEDFLLRLNSRKRKKVRRERERVREQGLVLSRHRGDAMDERQWERAHHFYASTFEKKWNVPVLTLDFFREIGRTMGEQITVCFATHAGREVAASILFQGDGTLYGRYWGCDDDYHSLHFEACYYQGIEHAIANELRRFEPGAQGEHKIARGFLPTITHSAHWIARPEFRHAIADYLERERELIAQRHAALQAMSPYRREEPAQP